MHHVCLRRKKSSDQKKKRFFGQKIPNFLKRREMVSKVSYLFSGPRNRQKRDFPPFSKVNSLLNPYQDYAHLKKHDCLVPTSVSRPSVNRFGSYLVMLQPHIPSGSPGARNVKIVFWASYKRCAPQWSGKKFQIFFKS